MYLQGSYRNKTLAWKETQNYIAATTLAPWMLNVQTHAELSRMPLQTTRHTPGGQMRCSGYYTYSREKNLPRYQRKTWAGCCKSLHWPNRCRRCFLLDSTPGFQAWWAPTSNLAVAGNKHNYSVPQSSSNSFHLFLPLLSPELWMIFPAEVWMQVDHTATKCLFCADRDTPL